MKIVSYILSVVLAVAYTAGCSKDIPTKAQDPSDEAWRYDLDLPVPIRFAADPDLTKASISSLDDLQGKKVGVFGFEKSPLSYNADDNLMMRNIVAECVVDDGVGSLQTDEEWYYPLNQDSIEYEFCSYYPRNNGGYISSDTQISVNVPVTNLYDVLWAKASVEDGFNGAYIRANGPVPSFEYKHKTACITFRASTNVADAGVKIMFVKFVDVPTTAQLCVADLENPSNVGNFISYSQKTEWSARRLDSGASGTLDFLLTSTPQAVCQPTFVAPCKTLKIKVDVRYGGSSKANWVEFELDPADLGAERGEEGFLAEYHYAFDLKVISPTEVEFALESGSVFDFEENQWQDAF